MTAPRVLYRSSWPELEMQELRVGELLVGSGGDGRGKLLVLHSMGVGSWVSFFLQGPSFLVICQIHFMDFFSYWLYILFPMIPSR